MDPEFLSSTLEESDVNPSVLDEVTLIVDMTLRQVVYDQRVDSKLYKIVPTDMMITFNAQSGTTADELNDYVELVSD